MSTEIANGNIRLTIDTYAVRLQKFVMVDVIVVQSRLSMAEVSQTIPLAPSLRIQLDLVIVRVIILDLSPVDDGVFELDAPKSGLSNMFKTPTASSQLLV
jgi:hypothetical protein